MNNDPQNQIPPEILALIQSPQMFEAMEKIGNTYGLLLDQIGEMEKDTRMVMIGKLKSADFLKTLSADLEISQSTASKIIADINTEIFLPLRESIRKTQETAEKTAEAAGPVLPIVPTTAPVPTSTPAPIPTPLPVAPQIPIAPIEKAGGFTVQRPTQSSSPLYKDTNLNREDVLSDLENIMKLRPENAENYVEHLLANPVKVEISVPAPIPVPEPIPEPAPVKTYPPEPTPLPPAPEPIPEPTPVPEPIPTPPTPIIPPTPAPPIPPKPPEAPAEPAPVKKKYEVDPYREPF